VLANERRRLTAGRSPWFGGPPVLSAPSRSGFTESHLFSRKVTLDRRKEGQMIQLLAARIQLAKMRAEEGQALVEYALIVSLIAVVAIAALTLTGTSIRSILNTIANDV
jgi:pilus assembly protein Flp/PilA